MFKPFPFTAPALVALTVCALLGAGCTKKTNDAPKASVSPSAAPSATPLPIAAVVSGMQTTLFNSAGEIVAKISAKEGATATTASDGTLRPEGLGLLKGGEAILYQKNKPTAVMNADTMEADRKTKTVVGTGNVRVRSLQKDAQNNASAIRADTMTWRHDDSIIRGDGHVLLTNGLENSVPGEHFEADTILRSFRIWNGSDPKRVGTGTF